MKKILLAIIAITLVSVSLANKEEKKMDEPKKQKVYSIVKQKKSLDWYKTQAELWKQEVQSHPKEAEAWLNYYTASRMLKIMGGGTKQDQLNKIVAQVNKVIPETFESYYITGWNANIGDEKITNLEKAYSIAPERPETYDGLLTHYELEGEKAKVKEFCAKIFESNSISSQIYAWNYNMLNSIEEDAILITAGDNDTYPSWILQQSAGVRNDIKVMNLSLLGIDEYRNRIFDELNVKRFDLLKAGNNIWECNLAMCEHLRKHASKPIYFASSINREIYDAYKDELYLVGLAFKWTEDSFDNIASLRKNYEKHFLKDHLKVTLFEDLSESVVDQMNGSYIMPLITLHNHYKETEEDTKMAEVDGLLERIAEKAGNSEAVKDIISPPVNEVVSLVITDPRDARYGFLMINDTLEASQMEISEEKYERFLLDLLKQKRYDELALAKAEKVQWSDLLIPQYKNLTPEEYFEHGEPGGENFPQVNISHKGATMYCEWLTNIYNNLDHRKKKYKKVRFRLPTEKEWMMLAGGGHNPKYKYPWGVKNEFGPKAADTSYNYDQITNAKGCYLANVQTNQPYAIPSEDGKSCPVHDGGVFPVSSNSYHPNEFGLYCIIGNVAEMIAEEGIAKGGGWNTQPAEATIQSRQKYDGPNPNVGFRVVMDIVEK